MIDMINIKDNLDKIKAQIQQACQQSGRLTVNLNNKATLPVTLLAVSKTKPITLIEQAYHAGQTDFGENYLQEAVDKVAKLSHLPNLCWHFIGPIQSNKTKQIASNFSWVHTLDREKIALRLNQHLNELSQVQSSAASQNQDTLLNVCLQVNISEESSKSGLKISEVVKLAETVNNCDKLVLRGLMAIPEKNAEPARYQQLQQLFIKLQQQYPSVDTLSLGMSNDLTVAINHGSTMVRIGTAIFGERTNKTIDAKK